MRNRSTSEQLLAVPGLAGARPRELHALAAAGDELDIREGRVLLPAGHRPRETFLVLSGAVEAVADGTTVARYGPGDVVGLAEEVVGGAASADVLAASPVRALVLSGSSLRSLLATNDAVRRLALRQLARQAQLQTIAA
jgi:CRP-like cAMP-binding protein